MTPTAADAPTRDVAGDVVAEELAALLARLGELTDSAAATAAAPKVGGTSDDVARIDQIALLERIQAAAAAIQAALMVRFARSQVFAQQRAVLADPRKVGRGIADQIALACRISPTEGSRRLGVARALHTDLPATSHLLRDGRTSAYVAGLVVSETRHLDPQQRHAVDQQLAGEPAIALPVAHPAGPRCSPAATPTRPTPRWSVPEFVDADLGCQFGDVPES